MWIQILEADLLDKESLHEALDMVNVVYNLASPTPDHEGQGDFFEVNTKELRNLLEEAEEHGVNDFIHLSTLDVFGFKKKKVGANEVAVDGWPPPRTPTRRRSSKPRAGTGVLQEGGRDAHQGGQGGEGHRPPGHDARAAVAEDDGERQRRPAVGSDSPMSFVRGMSPRPARSQRPEEAEDLPSRVLRRNDEGPSKDVIEACGRRSRWRARGLLLEDLRPTAYAAAE